MNSEPVVLELAHTIPGRARLRWKGPEPPPEDLLASFRELPGMRAVEYRPASRSLLLLHSNGIGLDALRPAAREYGVELREEPGPAGGPAAPPVETPIRGGRWVADLEAVLLLGLMVTWVRDLVTGRGLRPGTVLLILLTGLNLYQYWQQRQRCEDAARDRPEAPEAAPAGG